MIEALKNMFYIGAGAAFLTKEKLEELKTELVEKGKVSQEEGKQLIDEMFKKSDEVKQQLEQKIQDAINDQLKKKNVATADDIAALKSQIEELKAMLETKTTEE
jgi:polyhydroxyalkanoate synthesis regulator phasin